MNKTTLRKQMLEWRLSLDKAYIKEASQAIAERFINKWGGYESYLLYSPINNEVDTSFIAEKLWSMGKKVMYPVVEGENLFMGRCYCMDDLTAGYKGILEPCKAENLSVQVAVVPGVAFDRNCCRIGYGKGYYDLFLAHTHLELSVGIAYAGQITDTVYPSDYDRPVDIVLTEDMIYWRIL